MKTVVSINLGNYGSTGRIMRGISELARENGYKAYEAYPNNPKNLEKQKYDIILESFFFHRVNRKLARITGYNGYFAFFSTLFFLIKLNKIKPDIIHLHNLHNSYINLPLLFGYIRKKKIKTVWTFHDCWPMTGRCTHFQISGCDGWKNGCSNCMCPKEEYPQSDRDRSSKIWKKKKYWFTSIDEMIIVTPSDWLADLVKESFFFNYPIRVIHNGINLSIFKPIESNLISLMRRSYKMVGIGVAYSWGYSKGLDVFEELAQKLNDVLFILIGLDKKYENKHCNVVCIPLTNSREELAKYYTMCDVFINPTRQEVFGLTNVEALACGIPVIAFKTGGCPEIITPECGIITKHNDADSIIASLKYISNFNSEDCIKRATDFDEVNTFKDYIHLYDEL